MNKQIRIASINIYRKDAIGNFCYDLAHTYEKAGFSVNLYADGFDEGSPVKSYESLFTDTTDQDIIFYNHSIYDAKIELITQLSAKKIVYFHGITPPELLRQYQPITADYCEWGLQQLEFLNQFNQLCVNSISTENQLRQYITPRLKPIVLPPIVASRDLLKNINYLNKKNSQHKKTVLVVGRVISHKRIEDAIKVISTLTQLFPEIDVELQVIGVFPENDYRNDIMALVSELNIADKVIFRGFISDEALIDSYAFADCLLMMSEHEGFGVPLLEALKAELPVLAYNKNSVSEVLGNAGCQIDTKDFNQWAHLLHRLLFDEAYRDAILREQRDQLKKLLNACDEKEFLKLISTV